jgi:glycosyltransferase involved in cell wall biosynthesis
VAKILILNASHLANNPRVVKEADTLHAAGHEVEVLGWALDENLAVEDSVMSAERSWKFTRVINLRPGQGGMTALVWRLQKRLAFEMSKRTGWQTAAQLGGWRRRYLSEARKRKPDLCIAHSAPMMWVAAQLQSEGFAVGVDMEDWFSREHQAPYPSGVVRALEHQLLRRGVHTSCPSRAMSEALSDDYGCGKPLVLYNSFRWNEREHLDGLRKDRATGHVVSIYWYSQTVGPGRGLEQLCEALPLLSRPVELHIRGAWSRGAKDWLTSRLAPEHRARLFTHDPVSNRELLSRMAEHDIGFAGELSSNPSRDLSITNKILQYLLTGLAVVASDTAGQTEVKARAGEAVSLFKSGDAASLAAALNVWLENPDALARSKEAAVKSARDHFCWERCEKALVESVEGAERLGAAD